KEGRKEGRRASTLTPTGTAQQIRDLNQTLGVSQASFLCNGLTDQQDIDDALEDLLNNPLHWNQTFGRHRAILIASAVANLRKKEIDDRLVFCLRKLSLGKKDDQESKEELVKLNEFSLNGELAFWKECRENCVKKITDHVDDVKKLISTGGVGGGAIEAQSCILADRSMKLTEIEKENEELKEKLAEQEKLINEKDAEMNEMIGMLQCRIAQMDVDGRAGLRSAMSKIGILEETNEKCRRLIETATDFNNDLSRVNGQQLSMAVRARDDKNRILSRDLLCARSEADNSTNKISRLEEDNAGLLQVMTTSMGVYAERNYILLAHGRGTLTVISKYGVNIGIVKLTLTEGRKVYAHNKNDGSTVATGGIDIATEYLRPLFANYDIIGVPVETRDRIKRKGGNERRNGRVNRLKLYIWGNEHSQLTTNGHIVCYKS
ncbi:hypothetical protein THAOC_10435, partial [Thalassiosira oceanica]